MTLLLQEGVQGRPVYRWTVEKYVRAIEAGEFPPDYQAELIDGIIVEKMSIGTPHAYAVTMLAEILPDNLPRRSYGVRTQNPVVIPPGSRPEPDAFVLNAPNRAFAKRDPTAADLLLVIEVSDSTYDFDRYTKLSIYAAGMVPEYWIVDISRRRLLRFAEPDGVEAYAKTEEYAADQTLDHPTFGRIPVAELFAD